ncbi:uncharacterized protein [Cherax quadricarinatus]
MSKVSPLKHLVLGPPDLHDVMKFLAKYYFTRENIRLGVGFNTVSRNDEEIIQHCLELGVAVGSREQTGRLVGVILCCFITADSSWYSDETKCTSQAEVAATRIVNMAKSLVDLFEDPTVKKVLYLKASCVHPDYARQGICKKLLEMCVDLGVERGCQMAVGVTTSTYVQNICLELGYENRATLDLNEVKESLLDLSRVNNTKFIVITKHLSPNHKVISKI